MAFRKPGTLLGLEERILEVVSAAAPEGIHGFAMAQQIAAAAETRTLVAHGTLYKALDRLRGRGLLSAEWEDPAEAERGGRPRRRVYRLTAHGAQALASTREHQTALRPGQAPA